MDVVHVLYSLLGWTQLYSCIVAVRLKHFDALKSLTSTVGGEIEQKKKEKKLQQHMSDRTSLTASLFLLGSDPVSKLGRSGAVVVNYLFEHKMRS